MKTVQQEKKFDQSWPFPLAAVPQATVFYKDFHQLPECFKKYHSHQKSSCETAVPSYFLRWASVSLKEFQTSVLSCTSSSCSEPFTSLWSWLLVVPNWSHVLFPNFSSSHRSNFFYLSSELLHTLVILFYLVTGLLLILKCSDLNPLFLQSLKKGYIFFLS